MPGVRSWAARPIAKRPIAKKIKKLKLWAETLRRGRFLIPAIFKDFLTVTSEFSGFELDGSGSRSGAALWLQDTARHPARPMDGVPKACQWHAEVQTASVLGRDHP